MHDRPSVRIFPGARLVGIFLKFVQSCRPPVGKRSEKRNRTRLTNKSQFRRLGSGKRRERGHKAALARKNVFVSLGDPAGELSSARAVKGTALAEEKPPAGPPRSKKTVSLSGETSRLQTPARIPEVSQVREQDPALRRREKKYYSMPKDMKHRRRSKRSPSSAFCCHTKPRIHDAQVLDLGLACSGPF